MEVIIISCSDNTAHKYRQNAKFLNATVAVAATGLQKVIRTVGNEGYATSFWVRWHE